MKNIKINPDVNWRAHVPKYAHDDMTVIKNKNIITAEGLQLNISDTMSNVIDTSSNNFTQLMLTDNIKLDDMLKLKIDTPTYPEQFTTSIIFGGFPNLGGNTNFLMILEKEDNTRARDYVIGQRIVDSVGYNSNYFEVSRTSNNTVYHNITLHDDTFLSINHNDNYANVFLKHTGDPAQGTSVFVFEETDLNIPGDDQKFRYIIDKEQGYLVIYKNIQGTTYFLNTIYDDNINGVKLNFTQPTEGDTSISIDSIIRIVPYTKQTKRDITLVNAWNSYRNVGDQNNLKVNFTKSYNDLNNNFLLSNTYTTNQTSFDILQLRNQVTPTNKSTRGNPFVNYIDCDHREYDKIFSGTNQIYGSPKLATGYNSYSTTIDLLPDNVTYFHAPQDMYPYDKINVNDSGLIEAGAIGGDTPIVSDKLFKKAADYKYNTPYGAPTDEETGVWLCSWLRSNPGTDWDSLTIYNSDVLVNYDGLTYRSTERNTGKKPTIYKSTWTEVKDASPVWVDRYYNPKKYTVAEALQVKGQYYEYTDKFDSIVKTLKADDKIIFDKKSDVCFEPGSLYAYYRIGAVENDVIIETLKNNLVHQGISPAYKQDRSLHVNNSETHLLLDGTNYVETNALNKTTNSDFTISFHLSTNDWSKKFGSQIVGNYTNHGVAIFNEITTTPYMVFTTDTTVEIYSSNFDHVTTITPEYVPIKTVHAEGSENLYILTKPDDYVIYQYDKKGMLVERFELPGTIVDVTDFNIDLEYIYILDTSGVYRFDINNENRDLLFNVWPEQATGSGSSPAGGSFITSPTTFIEPYGDSTYRINCDTYTLDVSGNYWFAKDNQVFKLVPNETRGINATFTGVFAGSLISLVSVERNRGGTFGNQIVLVGDGSRTLEELITVWNNENSGNRVEAQVLDSLGLILPNDYVMQLSGGVDRGASTTQYSLSGDPGNIINQIKSDIDGNLWVLSTLQNETTIYKMTPDRAIIFCSTLTDIDNTYTHSTTNHLTFDMVTEYIDGTRKTNVVILSHTTNSTNVKVIKLNLNGSVDNISTKTLPFVDVNPIDSYHNFSNFDTVKRLFYNYYNNNYMTLKMRYQSYFDTDRTYIAYLHYNVSELTAGEHHFAASFNSLNGNLSFFIDGVLTNTATSNDTQTGAAYKFSKTIHNPLFAGCDSFFNNITLSENLKLENMNFAMNCTISNISVYNEYLNFYKIKALTRKNLNIRKVVLTLPTGKRSYVDQMPVFYKHKIPGRKANYFDIDVISTDINDINTQLQITEQVKDQLTDNLPVNVKLNNMNWKT